MGENTILFNDNETKTSFKFSQKYQLKSCYIRRQTPPPQKKNTPQINQKKKKKKRKKEQNKKKKH